MGKKAKGRGKGKCAKKNRVLDTSEAPEVTKAPHSFVLHRGLTCPYITDLTRDFRQIMEPFTASSLKERKANKIKDFVSLSAVFHVSHMCVFNKAQTQLSFKAARLPRGPTLTFKVHQFTLARDVLAASRKQYYDEESFQHPPLVVMNNFTGEGKHLKLMASTFQNMFPSINLAKIELSTIKRCVIFSYNPVTKLVDMRHYAITVVPAGLNRGVKKMVQRKIPNLGRCDDVSEFLTQGYQSESEFEDDEANQVVLPQTLKSRGNTENSKSAVRLHEIGPRLTMELVKIEEGLMTGEVLFHDTIVKTDEEKEAIRKEREKKKRLKEHRKKTQAENTEKKEKHKEDLKKKSLAGMKRKHEDVDENGVDNEPDNDAEYYRQEVGEEPDDQLFTTNDGYARKQRGYKPKFMNAKRRKFDSKDGEKGEKKFYKKNDDQNDRKGGGKFKRNNQDGGKQRDGKFKRKPDDGKNRDRKPKSGMKPKRNRK